MLFRRGSSLVTTILSVAAAAGVGVAGFSVVNGGLGGSCSAGLDANAAVVVDGSTCPITGKTTDAVMVSGEAKSDCCPLGDSAVEATLVSAESAESCMEACSTAEACSDEQKAACEMSATLVAAEGESCSMDKAACSTEVATLVTAEGESCSADKAACETTATMVAGESCDNADKCCGTSECPDADAECCDSAAEEIASAD